MIIQVLVEDALQEIYDLPGTKQQVDAAVLRTLLAARDIHYDRTSRQSVLSRGFVGTGNPKV
jgi:hypothetical protein